MAEWHRYNPLQFHIYTVHLQVYLPFIVHTVHLFTLTVYAELTYLHLQFMQSSLIHTYSLQEQLTCLH